MKRLRVARGHESIEIFDMPSKVDWEIAYLKKYPSLNFEVYYSGLSDYCNSDTLYLLVKKDLRHLNTTYRIFARQILRHFNHPIK